MKPAATVRLTSTHFALYRAYLEGVDDSALHRVYGAGGTDVRATRRLIATIRDTLAAAARRAGDTAAAHLLRLRPGSIPPGELAPAGDAPSLDAIRETVDPDGVYGEAELLALFRDAYPPAASVRVERKLARNARLRERQPAALAEDSQLEHPLDHWFEPVLAARFAAAGLVTLGDLPA
jgi:hypothetical protein